MRIPQQFHTLDVPFQNRAGLPENVVNRVKTIMVNGPLRQGPLIPDMLRRL
jgi:hypothetical protein